MFRTGTLLILTVIITRVDLGVRGVDGIDGVRTSADDKGNWTSILSLVCSLGWSLSGGAVASLFWAPGKWNEHMIQNTCNQYSYFWSPTSWELKMSTRSELLTISCSNVRWDLWTRRNSFINIHVCWLGSTHWSTLLIQVWWWQSNVRVHAPSRCRNRWQWPANSTLGRLRWCLFWVVLCSDNVLGLRVNPHIYRLDHLTFFFLISTVILNFPLPTK